MDQSWKALLRRLQSLPELAMRREVVREQLSGREPEAILEFLELVLAGADRRRPRHLLVKEAVAAWLLEIQPEGPVYELLAAVYALARERGAEGVAHLLLQAQPQRGPVGPEQTPGDRVLSQLPLGERKFLARGHDRLRLERLLLDPDPGVVRNLLLNPSIVEADAVRLASRRPVREEVLREIYASRWAKRYAVRKALVCNPYTPTDLALKLVGFLLRRDLKMVSGDGTLHELVRAEARRLVRSGEG